MDWPALSYWTADNLPYMMATAILGLTFAVLNRRRKSNFRASNVLKDAIEKNQDQPYSLHPSINPNLCAGCGACVRACPEGEILQLINHRAALVAPTKCVGHGECEAACPFDAITLVFGTKTRGKDIPRITSHYETNIPGLYIAGELGGMGLIRNAVRQGRKAAEHAAEQLKKKTQTHADFDLIVIGAGPAGIAAGLSAHQAGLNYLCIEQGRFGGTIANFPRQKIIMTQPADLPIVGIMRFPRHRVSKEELMQRWDYIRTSTGLKVKENTKFETLVRIDNTFHLKTSAGPLSARRVILALGVRGTPRRLGLIGEGLSKVTYNLIEPDQYKNQHISIVGSGNSAAEAVDMLCKKHLGNTVTLLAATAGFDRCNFENEEKVRTAEKAGSVKLMFETKVEEIYADRLEINVKGQRQSIKNDYLFIFIGAEMQTKFFTDIGINIDRKFGEPLRKDHEKA